MLPSRSLVRKFIYDKRDNLVEELACAAPNQEVPGNHPWLSCAHSNPSFLSEALVNQKQLAVIYRPIDALVLNSANPRLHSRRQIRQIARSIQTFGFLAPILVDRDLKVIAGHGRVLASRELKAAEVPTISVDHLSRPNATNGIARGVRATARARQNH